MKNWLTLTIGVSRDLMIGAYMHQDELKVAPDRRATKEPR